MFQHIFKFEHPATIFVAGPTQAGKTHWVIDLLKELNELIVPTPERIHWAYGVKNEKQEQKIKKTNPSITFSEGFPDLNIFDSNTKNLLILDDLMDEIGKNKDCANLFTRGSHHNNITVIAIVHNIFNQDKYFRTLTLNGQNFVFFNSPCDRQQLLTFGRRIFPQHKNFLPAALEEASKMNEHGYIVIRMKASVPDSLRVCTNIFKHQIPVWFLPSGSVV
jgi:hypothetical protein